MKNKKLILVVLLVLMAMCGTAVAYMFKVSKQQNNSFIPAQVSCKVEETFVDNTRKTGIFIENTSNITVYLRLRLVTYWINTDSKGNEYIEAKASASLDGVQFNESLWLKGPDDTYYYKQPVNANDGSSNLHITQNLLRVNPIELQIDDEDGSRQVIEVFAEAIQSNPKDAVHQAWPYVEVDSNGNLKKAI